MPDYLPSYFPLQLKCGDVGVVSAGIGALVPASPDLSGTLFIFSVSMSISREFVQLTRLQHEL